MLCSYSYSNTKPRLKHLKQKVIPVAKRRPIPVIIHQVSPAEHTPHPAQEISRVYLRYLKRRTTELGLTQHQTRALVELMLTALHTRSP